MRTTGCCVRASGDPQGSRKGSGGVLSVPEVGPFLLNFDGSGVKQKGIHRFSHNI